MIFFIIKDLENGKKINYTGSFITPQPYDIYDCIPIKSGQEIKLTVDLFKIYSGIKKIKSVEIKYSWVFSYYDENSININFANEKIESNNVYLYQWQECSLLFCILEYFLRKNTIGNKKRIE